MMKKIAILLFLAFSGFACTRNNGDIGYLFGTWKLTEIKIDGDIDQSYNGNIFFAFQNNAVAINQQNAPHDDYWAYGVYSHDGDAMSFTYNSIYTTPSILQFTAGGTTNCTIETLTNTTLTLTQATQTKTITYTLKKQI